MHCAPVVVGSPCKPSPLPSQQERLLIDLHLFQEIFAKWHALTLHDQRGRLRGTYDFITVTQAAANERYTVAVIIVHRSPCAADNYCGAAILINHTVTGLSTLGFMPVIKLNGLS